VALVSEQTISTERPPRLRIEGVAWSAQRIPTVVNLGFLDRSRYFSFKYIHSCPHEAEGTPFQTRCFSENQYGNRTRDLWICSQKLWPVDHRGGRACILGSDFVTRLPISHLPSARLSPITPVVHPLLAVSLCRFSVCYWCTRRWCRNSWKDSKLLLRSLFLQYWRRKGIELEAICAQFKVGMNWIHHYKPPSTHDSPLFHRTASLSLSTIWHPLSEIAVCMKWWYEFTVKRKAALTQMFVSSITYTKEQELISKRGPTLKLVPARQNKFEHYTALSTALFNNAISAQIDTFGLYQLLHF
jgi:hypothetical protein